LCLKNRPMAKLFSTAFNQTIKTYLQRNSVRLILQVRLFNHSKI
jgi:hypothetical protein